MTRPCSPDLTLRRVKLPSFCCSVHVRVLFSVACVFFFQVLKKWCMDNMVKETMSFPAVFFQEALILGFWWVKLQIPPGEVCQIMSNGSKIQCLVTSSQEIN